MVKPQFEVGKDRLGKGGVVRDLALRAEAVADGGRRRGRQLGWGARAVAASPLPGPSGNVEFFLWLRQRTGRRSTQDDIDALCSAAASPGVPSERLDP